jgi:hypothetical protein
MLYLQGFERLYRRKLPCQRNRDSRHYKIVVETDSYNKTLEQLSEIVPKLPDIYKFSWHDGKVETLLYEAPQTRQYIPDNDLVESRNRSWTVE